MKTFKLFTFLIILLVSSVEFVKANNEQPRGIDLDSNAFGIPAKQLGFNNQSCFTLLFWINIKEFNHAKTGTHFVNIRDISQGQPMSDWGYMWSDIRSNNGENEFTVEIRAGSNGYISEELTSPSVKINSPEWRHISFVFDIKSNYENKPIRDITLFIDGIPSYNVNSHYTLYSWYSNYIVMIGGYAYNSSPLNAYVDKVQFYNRALTQTEVQASMYEPLLNDESLLGYWDFENGCTTDTEGYMMADKGTIKATMYNILQTEEGFSNGTEIKPFTFAEGVNPESVLQGVEEHVAEVSNTRAYASNGVLYIENAEGVNTVTVYDAMGRVITSGTYNSSSVQIQLPATLKGVAMVKVNNEVVKVICE
ncbi:MAG: LamG domain-containing protein [Bacteroidales bacterium]|nr:LamG domain-containing protein [Bacteroidales bacterium]